MFRLRHIRIDTHTEHIVFLHRDAVEQGGLGLEPLDRVRVTALESGSDRPAEIEGVLNFCHDGIVDPDEVGLSESAFRDLGLPEGARVDAALATPPESVHRVRGKLDGGRLSRADFDAVLRDVARHRYTKVELSMFVLACALRRLDDEELIDLTRAMIDVGERLTFASPRVADKHCIGGIPGNRTTMVVVPIVASLGAVMPKTSSRAITSPAGTADTMGVLADVALGRRRMLEVVERTGGCVAWGGALDLAPADDVLITVERPMNIDTESQMIASILSKKKAAGATHTVLDIPVGPTAKVESRDAARALGRRFETVARAIGLELEVVLTAANGPVGRGVGPRLEAIDVLSVLRGEPDAPRDLREKSLHLSARVLEVIGAVPPSEGYVAARRALDSGAALRKFEEIVAAQGPRALPPPATQRAEVVARADGRIAEIDCRGINALAKLAGAPAHPAAGVALLCRPGDVVERGQPLCEVHARSRAHLDHALARARDLPGLFATGY